MSALRRYGLNTAGRVFMLDDDQPDEIAYFANLNDHKKALAERDELRAEVERLRQRDDEMRPIVNGLRLEVEVRKHGEEELAAENATLKERVAALSNTLIAGADVKIEVKSHKDLCEQRDELADALLPYAQRNRAAVDVSRGIEPSAELLAAEAALRKVGRLP